MLCLLHRLVNILNVKKKVFNTNIVKMLASLQVEKQVRKVGGK